jgi:hypothetical protein
LSTAALTRGLCSGIASSVIHSAQIAESVARSQWLGRPCDRSIHNSGDILRRFFKKGHALRRQSHFTGCHAARQLGTLSSHVRGRQEKARQHEGDDQDRGDFDKYGTDSFHPRQS